MYPVVPLTNTGNIAPLLTVKLDNVALDDTALVTVTVYVLLVLFCAVTLAVIVLGPTTNGMLPDAVPDVTAVPFTVTVAVASLVVGVTVIDVTVFATLAV